MKHLKFLFLSLINFYCLSQSNSNIELLIEPNVLNRIYVDEKTEFECFLINKSDEKYYVPARNLTEYPKSFVYDDFDLFGPDGKEILFRSAPGGSGGGASHPARVISENGGKVKSRSFFYTFSEPGTYRLVLKYHLDKDFKPANSSTDYKSFEARTELNFEVFDRSAIPFEVKEIDFETYKKQPQIKDISKTNDSTNVYNIAVSDISEEDLKGIAKFKNLRGLSIYSKNLHQLPDAIYDLDLFDLTLNLATEDSNSSINLSKIANFKNLRNLTIVSSGEVILVEDFSVFEHLQVLSLIGFKNSITIKALPKGELTKLVFKNLAGLNGIDGNFSEFKKLGRLTLVSIQNFTMPAKFSGNIWELELSPGPFTVFPDLSELTLARFKFYSFTGESLPENFQSFLKQGAQLSFPEEMYNSKDYKKLKRAGFTVFPKSI